MDKKQLHLSCQASPCQQVKARRCFVIWVCKRREGEDDEGMYDGGKLASPVILHSMSLPIILQKKLSAWLFAC